MLGYRETSSVETPACWYTYLATYLFIVMNMMMIRDSSGENDVNDNHDAKAG